MIWLNEVYFTLAIITARILTRHKFSLRYSPEKMEDYYEEWRDFKFKKAKDFGFEKPE